MENQEDISLPTWGPLQCPELQKRACHSTVIIDDLMIGFGGWDGTVYFNDAVALNLTSLKWEKVKFTGSTPIARYTHTSNVFQEDKIVVVGGYSSNAGVMAETSIMTLVEKDPLTFSWEVVAAKGGEALHRSDHTANVFENNLYLMGGADEEEESTDELWKLDLEKFEWTRISPLGAKPGDRYGHVSGIYQGKMLIFGGFSTKSGKVFNDMWALDLGKLQWQNIIMKGPVPVPIAAASGKVVDGKFYIFGGNSKDGYMNDFLCYDIRTETWQKIAVKGDLPSRRSYHACVYYNNQYIVWGGENGQAQCLWNVHALRFEPSEEKQTSLSVSGENRQRITQQNETTSQILRKINQEKLFSDIVIEVEGEEIAAHKGILAASCRFFYELFMNGMTDPHAKKIAIPDIKAEIFKEFLKFVYCEEMVLNTSLAIELLKVSEKYVMPELKKASEAFLAKSLTVDNTVEIAIVAEQVAAEDLLVSITKFVKAHKQKMANRADMFQLPKTLLMRLIWNTDK